ncbi:MAG: asparagine synthase (glutamine-hydrolyzing) [Deltaproteobacteria bacterium]|nr:asparagine synthase (glutamine-hydrolyzing) [Deltaproteobacteria bacterium]
MCGLAGFLGGSALGTEDPAALALAMAGALAHRGPDDRDAWADPAAGVALGHCRLAILDLSPQGRQPMHAHDGRLVLAYNGEIYNYREIRERLEREDPGLSGAWRGRSDSEVLLEAVARWGLVATLERVNGMFALAVWDRETRQLCLARDRLGEKPLYYGRQGRSFLFGSELKALARHPDFRREVDREALALFMRHGYVPGPRSIVQGIHKLPPGAWLCLDPARGLDPPPPQTYWSARQAALDGLAHPLTCGEEEATDRLEALLTEAVGLRLVSDVPLGAFLSGGVDSSTVAALMTRRAAGAVKTFTIGFWQKEFDEAPRAREVARHLGAEHTELYVTPADALEVIPRLGEMFDEPFADASQIPTHLVSRLARQKVTVCLSGDGGDELFGGYSRYFLAHSLWRRLEPLPIGLRRAAARAAGLVPPAWLGRALGSLAPAGDRPPAARGRAFRELLAAPNLGAVYARVVSQWKATDPITPGVIAPPTVLERSDPELDQAPDFARLMYWDTVTYLPDDILVKLDRAAMAVSLESRVPLLDHRVVELAWRLPLALKVRNGQGKYLLRQVLARHLPPALWEGPKRGFEVPLAAWLRGELRPWAADLLAEDTLARQGFLNAPLITRRWRQHLAGQGDWHYYLWNVLMFQLWLGG